MSSRQSQLEVNLRAVEAEIAPFSPTLIVVTKTYPVSDVEILHSLGVKHFGENRSSEGLEKSASIKAHWSYQGEIQSKKIREILQWADCIHSLDSQAHAGKIDRALAETGRSIEVFLQLSLDGDATRGGVQERELLELAESVSALPSITMLGIMCVPPVNMVAAEALSEIAEIHHRFTSHYPKAQSLSAGMSGDYLMALEHGATHIRVGSKILGSRHYDQ